MSLVSRPWTAIDVPLKSVLIATDFSQASQKPLRHALGIARHFDAKLYLAHVVSSLGFTLVGGDAMSTATELAWSDARRLEEALAATGQLDGLRHEVLVSAGDIWTELERIIKQQHVDMVVLGTHSRRGLGKLLLGSVAEQIFRHASCPVLTVGPNSPADADLKTNEIDRPLLFATDFGEASIAALPYAVSFANQRRTKLVLIHVASSVPPILREKTRLNTVQRLEELTQNAELTVAPTFMAEFGEPSEEILQTAKTLHAEAIIMGLNRRAHVGTVSHLPWSTAYEVACSAVCPVLTVRD